MNTRSWIPRGQVQLSPQTQDAFDEVNRVAPGLGDLMRNFTAAASQLTEPWVQTQSANFYDQLAAGARYLAVAHGPHAAGHRSHGLHHRQVLEHTARGAA